MQQFGLCLLWVSLYAAVEYHLYKISGLGVLWIPDFFIQNPFSCLVIIEQRLNLPLLAMIMCAMTMIMKGFQGWYGNLRFRGKGTGRESLRVATSRRMLASLSLTIASKAEKDNRFVHLGAFFARSRVCVCARLTVGKGEMMLMRAWTLQRPLLLLLLLLGMAFWWRGGDGFPWYNDSFPLFLYTCIIIWVEYLLSCAWNFRFYPLFLLAHPDLLAGWTDFASAGLWRRCGMLLMEDNGDTRRRRSWRELTVLLVPYCLVQGVVFSCSCSA